MFAFFSKLKDQNKKKHKRHLRNLTRLWKSLEHKISVNGIFAVSTAYLIRNPA